MAVLFVGREGDGEGRDSNLSVVIGFGLCVNGMNWPFWLYFLCPCWEGRLKFPRAIDGAWQL